MQACTSELRTPIRCRAFARPRDVLNTICVYVWDTESEPIAGLHSMRCENYFRPGSMLSCIPADGKILWHFLLSAATKRIAGTGGNSQ